MIRISRNQADENGDPIRPPVSWFDDAAMATQKAIEEAESHEADSTIYGHNAVRAALEKLFHDKCAYCETKSTAGFAWDVEHFRPKGRVSERQAHPGYYWLAYIWENLYPACEYCNQRRRDKPRWGDSSYWRTGGKWDQFPLQDEEDRAMSPNDDVGQESPLLIDPCGDDPTQHLEYDVRGDIDAMSESRRGLATIDICNLKRRRLRDNRREVVSAARDLIRLIRKCRAEAEPELALAAESFLTEHLTADNCRYAGAARAVEQDPDRFGV